MYCYEHYSSSACSLISPSLDVLNEHVLNIWISLKGKTALSVCFCTAKLRGKGTWYALTVQSFQTAVTVHLRCRIRCQIANLQST